MLAKGDLLLIQGKQPETEAQFQQALELDANNDALYVKLGKYYFATKNRKKLRRSIRKGYKTLELAFQFSPKFPGLEEGKTTLEML